MPQVEFTQHLVHQSGVPHECRAEGDSVADLIDYLEQSHPGIKSYLVDEQGSLRKHVNVFIDNELIADRKELSDPLAPDSRVHILQALSGG